MEGPDPRAVHKARWSCFVAGALLSAACDAGSAPPIRTAHGNPERPVRVVVPVAAAGGTDIIARIVMTALAESLSANFLIDNRAGAGGLLGTEIVSSRG